MSAVSSERKARSFTSLDEEEDALLNEAISCSRNMEIKTEDEDEEEQKKVQVKIEPPRRSSKLWCDMTSDTSSSLSDLSNGKIDLSTSGENVNASLLNGKECNKSLLAEDQTHAEASILKCKPVESLQAESKEFAKAVKSEPMDDGQIEDENYHDDVPETNGRNCKRVREGEDNDEYSKVPKNRRNSTSSSSTLSSTDRVKKPFEYETDSAVLSRRQKDIDYGKNTVGYDRYISEIPKTERTRDHPRTPPMHLKCSRRGWDGMIKVWRKQLHLWDPKNESDNNEEEDTKS